MLNIKSSRPVPENITTSVATAYEQFKKRSDLGFARLSTIEQSVEACSEWAESISASEHLVVIGMGGSSLGAQTLVQALVPKAQQRQVHFLDNVDVASLEEWLEGIENLNGYNWLLCSKSGGTIEALAVYDYCDQFLKSQHGQSIINQTFVISEDKISPMTEFANKHELPLLHIPMDVGGRFSVFTPVGLVPALFCGLDLNKLFRGVSLALEDDKAVIDLTSQLWHSHQLLEPYFYNFQYSDRLISFGRWLQQLWSESLGKAKRLTGQPADSVATMIPCRGVSDQHSVLQQIIEGAEKKFVTFHRVKSSEAGQIKMKDSHFGSSLLSGKTLGQLLAAEAKATEEAIAANNCGTLVLNIETLNEESMAQLMMTWMLSVGILGELLEINAFDQPGVESGKIITRRVLSQPN